MTTRTSNSAPHSLIALLQEITPAEMYGGLAANILLAIPADEDAVAQRDQIYDRRKAEYPLYRALSGHHKQSVALRGGESDISIQIEGMIALVECVINIAEILDSEGSDEAFQQHLLETPGVEVCDVGHVPQDDVKPLFTGAKRLSGLSANLRAISFEEFLIALTEFGGSEAEAIQDATEEAARFVETFPFLILLYQQFIDEVSHHGPESPLVCHQIGMLSAGNAMLQIALNRESHC